MALKGGIVDASGEKIVSHRIVTDADANAGLGDLLDPLRVDPTGTTVQPVSFSSPQHVIVDSGGGSNASVGTTGSAVPASATLVGGNKSGNLTALALDASGNLNVAVQAGGGGGTQYTDGTTQATPTGTVALGKNPSNVLKALPLDASNNQLVAVNAALPAGSAVIGHVITDATSVTTATLNAETTKVIGVTRTADGAGNLLTSNSTTPTAHFALDSNITSILGTAPTTVGKLDVKAADGDVFIRQATAANLNCTATLAAGSATVGSVKVTDGTNTAAVKAASTAAAATDPALVVAISPNNTVNVTDATNGPVAVGTAATKSELQGFVFNTTAPAPTNGQQMAGQADAKGNLLVSAEGRKATYGLIWGLTTVNGVNLVLLGSGTKIVKVTRIRMSATAASLTLLQGQITIENPGPTSGTSAALVTGKHDGTQSAATASAKSYSVAPTDGTNTGLIEIYQALVSSATVAGNFQLEWRPGTDGAKPITLNSASDVMCIKFNAASMTVSVAIEWTEE